MNAPAHNTPTSTTQKFLVGAVLAVLALAGSAFIVDETEFALEIRLGEPFRVIEEPGLYFRIPLITDIQRLDNRLITYDARVGTIITRDKKTMAVDNFAKWQIVDPLRFYQTVRNVQGAESRMDDLIYSQVREVLGKYDLEQIISNRTQMLEEVTNLTRIAAANFGVEVMDVRIKRADLPAENSLAVFGRMEAERRREAQRYRSEGEEEALKIRSQADLERTEMISTARRESEEVRGNADAEAARIYAEAFSEDTEFSRFWRSQEAYRTTLNQGATVILNTEDPFLEFFR